MIDVSPSHIVIGTRIGRYEIRGVLGSGGMGVVYVAFDTNLERLVALKILLASRVGDPSYLTRFKQEALSVSALNHPHILTVYDVGISDGRHFISMELIEGITVRKRLQQKTFEISEALHIVIQVADALVAAHGKNIIHRDIKPENIMLRGGTYAKLLDFGLAKVTDSARKAMTETAPGTIMGTPLYMSPEQASGDVVDVRTDIWSLGIVLYEMLTGYTPFTGSNVTEVMRSILNDAPAPLPPNLKGNYKKLESLIEKTVAKKAGDRYQSATELLISLNEVQRSISAEGSAGSRQKIELPSPAELKTVKVIYDEQLPSRKRGYRRKNIRSLAILPFVNAGSGIKSDYLNDGLTEIIINTLSQLPQLRVMARSSVFRFKDRQENPVAIGNELGVAAVLTGRLQRVGSKLVVQTELVDVADGSQLWGAQLNCKRGNVLHIQEEIANDISEKLKLNLSTRQKERLAKRPTVNEDAYHSYLRGRFCWNKRSTEGLRQSIDFFNNAIEIDPLFALAYAGIADAYAVLGNQHSLLLMDAYAKAKAAALKALAIDETLAEAYPTLGYIRGAYERDWSASEQAFRKAISLNPGYATAHQWYSAILRALGRVDEALEEARTAFSLDPLSPIINANVGLCMYVARRYDEAAELFRTTIMVEPRFFWSHYLLGLTQRQQGQHAAALTELRLALTLASDKETEAVVISDLAYSCGVLGDLAEANRLIGELKTLAKVHYVSPYDLAVAHLGIGDKDAAFGWLADAYHTRDEGLLWLKVDPVLDEIRSDARYLTLLKQVGLDELS
jgi:serine/threonine protein kinase/tetratricopeptide (TPR) repeat protein